MALNPITITTAAKMYKEIITIAEIPKNLWCDFKLLKALVNNSGF
jgi:hypothetical protein